MDRGIRRSFACPGIGPRSKQSAVREKLMDKQFINPPELYTHPRYSHVITVMGPCKFIFIAGQTPSDDKYQPVFPGD